VFSTLSVNKAAYNKLQQGLPAALGMRVGADHNSMQENKLE